MTTSARASETVIVGRKYSLTGAWPYIRSRPSKCVLTSCLPEETPRDLRYLDLVRPRIDLQHLGVAAQLLDLELGHVAVAAEDLHGLERDLDRRLRRVELARRRLGEGHRLPRGGHLDLPEHDVLEVHARDLHLRELQLDQLEFADRAPELDARPRVLEALREALLDDPERHRRDAGPLHRERRLRARTAGDVLGLADEPVAADAHVLEEELPRRRGMEPHLPERLRLREARREIGRASCRERA